MTDYDVVFAPRIRCVQCGFECDWGECCIDDDGEAVCPECGGRGADI